jgi:hypothetical protein
MTVYQAERYRCLALLVSSYRFCQLRESAVSMGQKTQR